MKEKVHFTNNWIVNPTIPLSVFLIGAGGTGSNMLSCLAIINKSLIALGHPGLHVTTFDDDKVTEANIARQLFYTSDLGLRKASVLIQRVNRAFGTSWDSKTCKYDRNVPELYNDFTANITISCVDSVEARREINMTMSTTRKSNRSQYDHVVPYYWIDCGNDVSSGQVYLGTQNVAKQPKSKYQTITELTSPIEYFKNEKDVNSTFYLSCNRILFICYWDTRCLA